MNKLYHLFLVLIFGSGLNLYGQRFIEPILQEPVQQAWSENAEIKIKHLESSKTQLDKDMVNAKRLPQLSVLGGYGFLYSRLSPEFPTHYLPITGRPILEDALVHDFKTQAVLGGISARQVIFTGLQIPNGLKALEEKRKAEEYMAEAGKEELAQEVIMTFDQLMLLEEVEILIRDSEKRLNIEHQKVIRGIENGFAIPYDRDKLKLAILELEQKKVELEGNRDLLLAKLAHLTKMEEMELRQIIYELKPFLVDEVHETPENRAELRALEAGKRATDYVLQKEKGNYWPTVFAFGNLSYFNAFDTSLKFRDIPSGGDLKLRAEHIRMEPAAVVGVGMKWDIFKGGENHKKVKKAELDREISTLKLNDTRDKLSLLLHKNKVDLQTAEKKLAVARQQLKVAENNLELASRQYASGLVDLTERLAAENEYYKINLNYFQQILGQRSATVAVLVATGELTDKIYD